MEITYVNQKEITECDISLVEGSNNTNLAIPVEFTYVNQ